MSQNHKRNKRFGEKRSAGRTLFIVLMVVLGLILLLAGVVYGLFSHYYGKMNQPEALAQETAAPAYEIIERDVLVTHAATPSPEDSPADEIADLEARLKENLEAGATELEFNENIYNILLIGSDNRADETARSDSMIVVSINRETKTIVLTSLMRDIYLTMPGYWNDRLNAAYAYGGPELLMDTIESNFGIPVDKYVQVGFQSFEDVVDILGGVTVEMSQQEHDAVNALGGETGFEPLAEDAVGMVELDGGQALGYVRIRNVGASDFDRTARQREVMSALFEKAQGMTLTQLNDLANAVLPQVSTNLSQGEIFSLLLKALEYLDYEMETLRLPVDGSYWDLVINGMWVLGIDFETNRQVWRETVSGGGAESVGS